MRHSVYQDRINTLIATAVALKSKDKSYSIFRLVFFITAVGLSIFLVSLGWLYTIACAIISLVLFSRLLKHHGTIVKERKLTEALLDLNNKEIKSLDNDHSRFANGNRYHDDKHPYTTDMDVFGDHSIFQMLNRASTIFGENKLSEVLTNRLAKNDIVNYQDASQELESKLDWRQRLYGLGKLDIAEHHDYKGLERWIHADNPLTISKLLVYLCVLFCWVLFIALLFYGVPFMGALLAFLPNVLLSYRNNKPITQIHTLLDRNEKYIKPYADIVSFLETSEFNSAILKSLKSNFSINNGIASDKLRSLASHLKQLDIRTNFFGFLFCYGFLWDHIYAMKVEDWKSENKDSLFKWLETIGEYEYISSIANFSFQNPEFCYPTLSDNPELRGLRMGHPLLHYQQRVVNDFSMKTQKHIKIVTGSNMGGKSTFLRTLGVNMILAYTGSRVCAKELTLPYLRLMSSMRTTDALKENTSSFYAELKRLKMILDEVKGSDDVFFLLDEILKGTNSNDRHNGAKAMIKQMIANNGSGLVSTHDLELGEMIKELPEEIDNICFEVNVEGEELVFDYKIKNGISKSFNATHLMRNIGIEI